MSTVGVEEDQSCGGKKGGSEAHGLFFGVLKSEMEVRREGGVERVVEGVKGGAVDPFYTRLLLGRGNPIE